MFRPQGALLDLQRLAEQAFGFRVGLQIGARLRARLAGREQFVFALLLQHVGEVVHAGRGVRMPRSENFFAHGERAPVHRFGFLELALQVEHVAQVGQTGRAGGMFPAERSFVNRDHPRVQGLGLLVLAAVGQLLRARAQLPGILARGAPAGLAELALQIQHPPEVGQGGGRILVLFPQIFFENAQGTAQQRFGSRIIAQLFQHQRQIVQRGRRAHMFPPQPLLIYV